MTQTDVLLTVLIVVIVALIVVLLLRPQAGGIAVSARVVLLAIALILFILTGLGVVGAVAWGLAAFTAAFLFG